MLNWHKLSKYFSIFFSYTLFYAPLRRVKAQGKTRVLAPMAQIPQQAVAGEEASVSAGGLSGVDALAVPPCACSAGAAAGAAAEGANAPAVVTTIMGSACPPPLFPCAAPLGTDSGEPRGPREPRERTDPEATVLAIGIGSLTPGKRPCSEK